MKDYETATQKSTSKWLDCWTKEEVMAKDIDDLKDMAMEEEEPVGREEAFDRIILGKSPGDKITQEHHRGEEEVMAMDLEDFSDLMNAYLPEKEMEPGGREEEAMELNYGTKEEPVGREGG
jgi:hypothetical protein